MAYTKVFAIRARLDDRVKYAVNGEKTELDERIVYTADPEKTDTVRFVTTLNCRPAETAFAAMQKTKKKYKKMGGVLGYHFIQSFAPGEVTPEQAHEIGCEFARRLFGNDFEVVIGTHLDKAHPHNHIKVLYPAASVEGKTGSVQLNLSATVVQYAIFYAVCAEKDRYGNVQNYMLDTDPNIPIEELEKICHNKSEYRQAQEIFLPTTAHILDYYDRMTPEEKNRLWKLLMEKITYYRNPEKPDSIEIHLYPRLGRLISIT